MNRPFVLLATAGVLASCGTHVQTPEAPGRPGGSTLPVEPVEVRLTPYFRELRTVEAVSGVDTLRLLLDTGGGHTLLTPEAAQRLGCQPFGRSVGHRMNGERVEFRRCSELGLQVAGVTLGPKPIAVFDLGAVLPSELPKLDGLLALPSFTEHVVTFDLGRDRLIFESEQTAAARRAEQRPLRARLASGNDGGSLTILVAAEAESAPLWLLLDNGNLVGTLLSPSGAQQILHDRTDLQPGRPVVADLHVIGLPIRSTPALIRDIIYDGVLGASFFLEHALTMDLRGEQPWLGATISGEP